MILTNIIYGIRCIEDVFSKSQEVMFACLCVFTSVKKIKPLTDGIITC